MLVASFSFRSSPVAHHARRAFTLLELIAVMTLISLFAGVIGFAFFRGGGSTIGLQSAQSTVASLLTLVRGQGAVTGRNAALFVNVTAGNRERYLRFLVPAIRNEANTTWIPLNEGVFLPQGCFVVPSVAPTGTAIENSEDWSLINSTVLAGPVTIALNSLTSETWSGIVFTPRGTIVPTPSSGNVVVANGRPNPPSATPPFVFVNPKNARGVALSSYGLTRLINDPAGF